jgi:hypothetical protein
MIHLSGRPYRAVDNNSIDARFDTLLADTPATICWISDPVLLFRRISTPKIDKETIVFSRERTGAAFTVGRRLSLFFATGAILLPASGGRSKGLELAENKYLARMHDGSRTLEGNVVVTNHSGASAIRMDSGKDNLLKTAKSFYSR